MATPNSEYWKQRFAQLEAAQNRRAQETFIDVGLAYRQAEKQLEADAHHWCNCCRANGTAGKRNADGINAEGI